MKEDHTCLPSPSAHQVRETPQPQSLGAMEPSHAIAMKRCDAARDFPHNTCGASRHLQLAAECLLEHGSYLMFEDEPEYMAETILTVVACLWEARTKLAALRASTTPNDQAPSDLADPRAEGSEGTSK